MNTSSILKKCQTLLQKNPSLLPKSIRIVEVGPRDGLQNESTILSPEYKSNMIQSLIKSGLTHIETGAFVSPKWVPQMANSDIVMQLLQKIEIPNNVILSALVPNVKGMERGNVNKK
jgi:hydroxymethylglutaryl-CoA lyase